MKGWCSSCSNIYYFIYWNVTKNNTQSHPDGLNIFPSGVAQCCQLCYEEAQGEVLQRERQNKHICKENYKDKYKPKYEEDEGEAKTEHPNKLFLSPAETEKKMMMMPAKSNKSCKAENNSRQVLKKVVQSKNHVAL